MSTSFFGLGRRSFAKQCDARRPANVSAIALANKITHMVLGQDG